MASKLPPKIELDLAKIDEMTLALLWLVRHGDREYYRAWKSFDWDALNRLHEKDLISDPISKAKSVAFTDEGAKLAEQLFKKHFIKTG